MLSHPLGILDLVGRYPTNNLVPRQPLQRRNLTICSSDIQEGRDYPVLLTVSRGYPGPQGTSPTLYYPVCRCPLPEGSFSLDLHA